MSEPQKTLVLIIDPDPDTFKPYKFLTYKSFKIIYVKSIPEALSFLEKQTPNIVFFNNEFSMDLTVNFLESFKNTITTHLIPLVFSLSFNKPIVSFPGTNWGNKLGIIYPQVSRAEFTALLKRLIK